MVAFIETFAADEISHIPYRAVIVKEQAGINTVSALYKDGVTPGAGWIFRSDDIVVTVCLSAFGNKGIDDVKGTVVITDRGRPESFGSLTVFVV